MLVLGFTMFVIALNMRHYSTTCDTQSARDASLNRAAMERRIKALETEIEENGIFLEKVLQGLDAAFQASAVLSVKELREIARVEASEIEERRARQPPPPMSNFARSRVSKAVDGGQLQDLVEAAVGLGASSFFSGGAGEESGVVVDGWQRGASDRDEGWDWGPAAYSPVDDFLNNNEVKIVEPAKLSISDEERETSCSKWFKAHSVTPRVDWGTLPKEEQKLWTLYRCDDVVLELEPSGTGDRESPAAAEKEERPLEAEGNGDGDGASQAAAAAGGRGGADSGGARSGEEDTRASDAAVDAEDGRLDEGPSERAEKGVAAVGVVR
eukprot:g20420.t1